MFISYTSWGVEALNIALCPAPFHFPTLFLFVWFLVYFLVQSFFSQVCLIRYGQYMQQAVVVLLPLHKIILLALSLFISQVFLMYMV